MALTRNVLQFCFIDFRYNPPVPYPSGGAAAEAGAELLAYDMMNGA